MSESSAPASNVFISYSRKDLGFVNRLCDGLEANNLAPKVDRAEIYSFEDWWQRIETLITEADTVIFALSPDAIASAVCRREVEFAQSLRKRFAPIVCRPVAAQIEQVPSALADLNFIYFDNPDAFEPALARLVEALSTDIGWVRKHTQFTAEAREWAKAARPAGLLLRSPRLETAERWIVERPANAPAPTEDTRAFLVDSRTAKTRQRNILNGSLFFGIVVALALAIFSYWQRNVALDQRNQSLIAQSYFLVDQSARDVAAADMPAAIGLALAALPENMAQPDRPYLPEAETALNSALQALKEPLRPVRPRGGDRQPAVRGRRPPAGFGIAKRPGLHLGHRRRRETGRLRAGPRSIGCRLQPSRRSRRGEFVGHGQHPPRPVGADRGECCRPHHRDRALSR